jgi:hypothetical protein
VDRTEQKEQMLTVLHAVKPNDGNALHTAHRCIQYVQREVKAIFFTVADHT